MSYEFAEGFKIRDQSATHFLTFSIMGWIDIFSRQRYRDLILESFQFFREKKGLRIGAYVIMSNHIHTIWTATNSNLSDIIRDFKNIPARPFPAASNRSRKAAVIGYCICFGFMQTGQMLVTTLKCGQVIITRKKYIVNPF
jgi:REP element-mobilizing transposase RayT